MFTVLTILIFIVCILLILIVLVQNSKGGGLAANMGIGNQIMGARRTADFLEKSTWTLAAALLGFSLLAGLVIPRGGEVATQKSKIEGQISTAQDPASMTNFPTAVPAQQPEQAGQE
jgi:preprotein translocase subunit SecG